MSKATDIKARLASIDSTRKKQWLSWGHLAAITLLSSYFYVLVEWIFFATKPSFMDFMPLGTKISILLLTGLLLSGAVLLLLLSFLAVSLILWRTTRWKLILWVGALLPGLVLAATTLILVDNFTYTVFKFGVVNTKGYQRAIYAALFVLITLGFTRAIARALSVQARKTRVLPALKRQAIASAALLLLSVPVGGSLYLLDRSSDPALPNTGAAATRPNILLIGTDGLNADHLSLYGYEKDTTPFLKELVQESLLALNNFSNANMTTGSHVSMLTGKPPTETRVLFPPDILQGANAFQHLPGILKREGYYNAQVSVDYYGDANAVNLQDAFVMVNGRTSQAGGLYTFSRSFIPEDSAYFLSTLAKRLTDRLLHIFFIQAMPDPYAQVTQKLDNSNDRARVDQTLFLFRHIQQPLFVHVYMMGTHLYMYDDYDTAVEEFDGYMREVTEALEEMGKLDNTILVIYTDHGASNQRNVRTPLIIRFPKGQYAGQVSHNTQLLDIAPTVLDYLGIQPPGWMSGVSLLDGEPPATRTIFSAVPNFRANNEKNQLALDQSRIKPPFYQFGIIDMVICSRWYSVDTTRLTWQSGQIQGYPNPCSAQELPGDDEAQRILLGQMEKDGFDVSALQSALALDQ